MWPRHRPGAPGAAASTGGESGPGSPCMRGRCSVRARRRRRNPAADARPRRCTGRPPPSAFLHLGACLHGFVQRLALRNEHRCGEGRQVIEEHRGAIDGGPREAAGQGPRRERLHRPGHVVGRREGAVVASGNEPAREHGASVEVGDRVRLALYRDRAVRRHPGFGHGLEHQLFVGLDPDVALLAGELDRCQPFGAQLHGVFRKQPINRVCAI